jgi:type I restriction enzyme S subunit
MKKTFDEVFEDKTKYGTKIKTDEYHTKGKYLIIDQGQEEVAGYTDLEEGVFTDVPAIIFGDHTRTIKYVDEPFFLGADGVKVLKSKFKDANYKYLYYVLKNAKIPNTGYNRHFKWLKEVSIEYPNPARQAYIVTILDKVTRLIDARQRELAQLDTLIKARFVELFGNLRDEVTVEHYIAALTAGKSLAGEVECENKVLKTGAASFDYFDASQVKNLPIDYEPFPEHMVRAGDIIISRMNTAELTGATAYVWDVNENVYLPDRLWRAELKDNCNPIFVWQLLIQPSTKEQIRREASGTSGSMKNISKPALLGIRVIKVSFEQQNKFADFVTQVDKSKLLLIRDP